MKKIFTTLAAVLALAGCVSSNPVVDPAKIANHTPDIWHETYMGSVNECKVWRTIMSDTFRIYSIRCAYKKDIGNLYQRGNNCRVERDAFRAIHFPDYKQYKIICGGPLIDYSKKGIN